MKIGAASSIFNKMESFNKLVATIDPVTMANLDPFYKLLTEIGHDAMIDNCYNFLMEMGEVPYDPLRDRHEQRRLGLRREQYEQSLAEITANTVVQPVESPELRVWRHRQMTERHWPFMRAKNVAKHLNLNKGRMNHMKILAILAERLNITVDELLHMNPLTYMQRHDKKYIRYTDLNKLFSSKIKYRLEYQLANPWCKA